MAKPKILAFAGSAREDSFNKKLIRAAAAAAEQAGADVTLIDLRDYPMPIVDQDVEAKQGLPENAKKIKQLMIDSDAFLISTPEYNSGMPPLLKNVIDWASRAESDDEPPLSAYKGKVAGLLAASPGGFGGMRALVPLRSVLGNIGVIVLPNQVALPSAHKAFDDGGSIKDEKTQQRVVGLASELVATVSKLRA